MIAVVCYLLSIPISIAIHPILGIIIFIIGNIALFWNMKLGSWGGNHYHTHYHNSNDSNLIKQHVTQAIEHRIQNKMGQSISVRKLTKWD